MSTATQKTKNPPLLFLPLSECLNIEGIFCPYELWKVLKLYHLLRLIIVETLQFKSSLVSISMNKYVRIRQQQHKERPCWYLIIPTTIRHIKGIVSVLQSWSEHQKYVTQTHTHSYRDVLSEVKTKQEVRNKTTKSVVQDGNNSTLFEATGLWYVGVGNFGNKRVTVNWSLTASWWKCSICHICSF